jgi:hypothetical protein
MCGSVFESEFILAEREAFLMRLDPKVLAGIRRWADDELRSVNGQLEFLLRKALKDAGRFEKDERGNTNNDQPKR